jgi:hypothetical protein
MELIAGPFLLVVVSLFGHISLVISNYLGRSKRAIMA